jgi:hypothetical protein
VTEDHLQVTWLDVVLVLLVFWLPAVGVYLTLILREVRKVRGEWRALKREMRSTTAEGFPPPGPPTTDSLS